jgi:cell filamentation protein
MSDEFVDPYFDPKIGDLRNLLGAKSSTELAELEAQAVFANELELADTRIPRSNDLTELCRIHAQLFKGVYDWAGQIRIVDIRKSQDQAAFFVPVAYIQRAAGSVFTELAEAKNLKGLPRQKFVEQLAYFYDQLNYIHPFREGNGRAQRVFWARVAVDAGYLIFWDEVIRDENDRASAAAMDSEDRRLLETMFNRIVKAER